MKFTQHNMKFNIVQYTTDEISPKSNMLTSISNEIEAFLKKKDYGADIDSLYIGLVCVNPQFEQFFQSREKYTKSKKMLEYSMKLEFERFKNSTENEAIEILIQNILTSIGKPIEKFSLDNFKIVSYKQDIKHLAIEKEWIND